MRCRELLQRAPFCKDSGAARAKSWGVVFKSGELLDKSPQQSDESWGLFVLRPRAFGAKAVNALRKSEHRGKMRAEGRTEVRDVGERGDEEGGGTQ